MNGRCHKQGHGLKAFVTEQTHGDKESICFFVLYNDLPCTT